MVDKKFDNEKVQMVFKEANGPMDTVVKSVETPKYKTTLGFKFPGPWSVSSPTTLSHGKNDNLESTSFKKAKRPIDIFEKSIKTPNHKIASSFKFLILYFSKRSPLDLFLILFTFSAILFSSETAAAQSQSMPPFSMQLTNGKVFSAKDLPQEKPVIIIYFAPDCEHCQALMNVLFKRFSDFKKAEIVMVTFKPMNEVVDFEKSYQTSKYPNIKVGIETPIFFFRTYYDLENTPFTALFDKHKKLIISYKKETPVDDLVKHLKTLN